jgi:hypothetical protein
MYEGKGKKSFDDLFPWFLFMYIKDLVILYEVKSLFDEPNVP